jgi:Ni,Fe-hydrogenase III large subunit
VVTPELAERHGLAGLAGRASGQANDLRADLRLPPYDTAQVAKAGHIRGDVAARVSVRFEELFESLRLVSEFLRNVPDGPVRVAMPQLAAGSRGCGWVEGWRGEVFIALVGAEGGRLHRVHAHDPSWQSWPLLERAVLGNIVPDFPLINKSFNLSYSGHDL